MLGSLRVTGGVEHAERTGNAGGRAVRHAAQRPKAIDSAGGSASERTNAIGTEACQARAGRGEQDISMNLRREGTAMARTTRT